MDERGFEPPASSLPMRFVTLKTNHLQRKYLSISDWLGQSGTALVYLGHSNRYKNRYRSESGKCLRLVSALCATVCETLTSSPRNVFVSLG